MLKKIWKDSVGSKVISWLIIGVLTIVGLKIKSYYDKKSFAETFNWLVNFEIKLVYGIGAIIVFLILRKLFKPKKRYYNRSQRKLKKFNNNTDLEQGVRNEWTVYFGSNGKPFISDLEFYCTEHGEAPLRFYGNNCSMRGCKNSGLNVNQELAKNHLESLVINEWNKIK